MTMTTPEALPLIVGAGPVGLAAALLLRRQGVAVRLIDHHRAPSDWSRALVVNPRTLDLLEPTGVSAKMLSLGLAVRGMQIHRGGRVVRTLSFDTLPHCYPFLLALSQATTERLLAAALDEAGGAVERGTELTDVRNADGGVVAGLKHDNGHAERYDTPWLLAADGARSTARGALGLSFQGNTFDRDWHLSDVPLETDLAADRAHILFLPGGRFAFCLRVIDDANHPPAGPPVWRVMGNRPDPIDSLPGTRAAGPAVWSSRFTISHRVAEKLAVGRVFLAGDAAHVHSPVGARGMNLGVEDAWAFAEAVRTGRLEKYGPSRRRVDRGVVRRIEQVTRMARGESAAARVARWLMPNLVRLSPVRRQMLAVVSGLDHRLRAP